MSNVPPPPEPFTEQSPIAGPSAAFPQAVSQTSTQPASQPTPAVGCKKITSAQSISQCGAQTSWIDLTNQGLESLPDLTPLTELEVIQVFFNHISGPLPDFSFTSRLRILDLSQNDFSGSIPETYGDLPLTGLYLNNNNLTGEIPASIGKLTGLTELVFRDNSLNGTIPASFANLVKLTRLDLGNNLKLTGTFPKFPETMKLNLCSIPSGVCVPEGQALPAGCNDVRPCQTDALSKTDTPTWVLPVSVVASFLFLAILFFGVFWFLRKKKQRDQKEELESVCSTKALERYKKVIIAYDPVEIDEIKLNVGDEVLVSSVFSDGWCKGLNVQSSAIGLFPGTCLSDNVDDLLTSKDTFVDHYNIHGSQQGDQRWDGRDSDFSYMGTGIRPLSQNFEKNYQIPKN